MEQKNVIFNGIYAIYDKVAESFSAPIASPNDRTAWRVFLDITKNFPAKSDISMYRIGTMCITASPDDDNIVQLELKPVHIDFSDEKEEVKA